jgi:hypothetical protein
MPSTYDGKKDNPELELCGHKMVDFVCMFEASTTIIEDSIFSPMVRAVCTSAVDPTGTVKFITNIFAAPSQCQSRAANPPRVKWETWARPSTVSEGLGAKPSQMALASSTTTKQITR